MMSTDKKVCFATVATDDYIWGLIALLSSMAENSPSSNGMDFYIFHGAPVAPLSTHSMELLERTHHEVKLHLTEIELSPYAEVLSTTHNAVNPPLYQRDRYLPAYLKFASFGLEEYDTVVYLDADLLCLGPLDDLINLSGGIYMARDLPTDDPAIVNYNTGVMTIGRPLIGATVLETLLTFSCPPDYDYHFGPADQAILNLVFASQIRELDSRFNTLKYEVIGDDSPTDRVRELDVRLLHFVSSKPWDKGVIELFNSENVFKVDALWEEHLLRALVDRDDIVRYLRHKSAGYERCITFFNDQLIELGVKDLSISEINEQPYG